MTDQFTTIHGGDLDTIERVYGIPRNEIIDFSGNINPLGLADSIKKAIIENIDKVTTYPDKNYVKLIESISRYTGAPKEYITVGNGSSELIAYFIQIVNAKDAVIIGPAYSEYASSIEKNKGAYTYFPLQESENFELNINSLLQHLDSAVQLLVICNPNNPTGSAVDIHDMKIILSHCRKQGIYVLVDETYAEFADGDISAIPLVKQFDNLFVIRGTSKFFACPGLRLGYGIGGRDILDKIEIHKEPWSVNSLACIAGEVMFQDKVYIEETKRIIHSEKYKVYGELSHWKQLEYYQTQSNFILLKLLNPEISAKTLFQKAIQNKMLIRDASSFDYLDETFFRFCFLKPDQNSALLALLKAAIE